MYCDVFKSTVCGRRRQEEINRTRVSYQNHAPFYGTIIDPLVSPMFSVSFEVEESCHAVSGTNRVCIRLFLDETIECQPKKPQVTIAQLGIAEMPFVVENVKWKG
jgi:hypothetical protein